GTLPLSRCKGPKTRRRLALSHRSGGTVQLSDEVVKGYDPLCRPITHQIRFRNLLRREDRLAFLPVSDRVGGERGVYSIGAVARVLEIPGRTVPKRGGARMLEIPVATIRNWEERYATILPERSPGGHRLYSRDHVEQLRFVAEE